MSRNALASGSERRTTFEPDASAFRLIKLDAATMTTANAVIAKNGMCERWGFDFLLANTRFIAGRVGWRF